MRKYDSWDDLVPAVVGLPAEEFETCWQSYVETRYGDADFARGFVDTAVNEIAGTDQRC